MRAARTTVRCNRVLLARTVFVAEYRHASAWR